MKKRIKRIVTVILVLCLSIIPLSPVSAATATPEEIMPMYNNVGSATATININSSGKLTIG